MTAPRKIEWAAPEGWTVWADEDGVHLRSRSGDGLEMPDVRTLLNLWTEACSAVQAGQVSAPKPPTRDEIRAMSSERAAHYAAKRPVRAIEAEFRPTDAPF